MSQGINRVLACVGLKDDFDPVLARAIELANATGAKLYVLHVLRSLTDEVLTTLRENIPEREVFRSIHESRLKHAREAFDKKIKQFRAENGAMLAQLSGGDISFNSLEGYAAAVISEFAKKNDVDMIVLASNKRTLPTTYTGKITKGVIKRTHVPVVVVPSRNTRK